MVRATMSKFLWAVGENGIEDMTHPFLVRCIRHVCSYLIGFDLITWPYLAAGEAGKIVSLF